MAKIREVPLLSRDNIETAWSLVSKRGQDRHRTQLRQLAKMMLIFTAVGTLVFIGGYLLNPDTMILPAALTVFFTVMVMGFGREALKEARLMRWMNRETEH